MTRRDHYLRRLHAITARTRRLYLHYEQAGNPDYGRVPGDFALLVQLLETLAHELETETEA